MDDSLIRQRQPSTSLADESANQGEKTKNLSTHIFMSLFSLCDIIPGVNPESGPGHGPYAGAGDLESVVECPVCLVIPRDLPIPSCPAGQCGQVTSNI